MILALPTVMALARQCAPGIAPEAIVSIASVESSFDTLAINVNHVGRFRPRTPVEAAVIATRWISAGYSVDLGIAQINSHNLAWTGLSIAAAFDGCSNLAAAEKVLTVSYTRASRDYQGLEAISRTFSLYNSGSTTVGFRNNYVNRVWRAAERLVPAMQGIGPLSQNVLAAARAGATQVAEAQAAPPSWVVGASAASVLVFK